ncbi:MAG TPA: flagellar motor switch protein FliN [Leptospiraceae bacterium]|nr:flagellar motor switch protein FliN [Leptospiraceae bacterium]HNN76108.1 flagellar motor switch protein FliN [Leptospiraceae bacterium]
MAEDGSLSQDEIDALLSMGDEPSPGGGAKPAGGGADDLNLDSLLGGDSGSSGGGSAPGGPTLDNDALMAIAGAVGGSAPRSAPSPQRPVSKPTDAKDNMELLMDVALRFTVELGRTQMNIKDVMMLGEGSIVELDKNVGDEVDVYVNDRLFGRGKLVVIDEFFGVQMTHILDPLERFRIQ